MPILLDTNQLLRIAQPEGPEYSIVRDAITKYIQARDRPSICSQNIYEFWSVATRQAGTAGNGLGMTMEEADTEISQFESFFPMLPDTEAVYAEWRILTRRLGVKGRQAHDARLVATMITHGIPNRMTFDIGHFQKYERAGIMIAGQPLLVIHPANA